MTIKVTTRIECPNNAWTQITTGEVNVGILIREGQIAMTMQTSKPTGHYTQVPINSLMQDKESLHHLGIPSGSYLYAYATNGDSVLTVDPMEL